MSEISQISIIKTEFSQVIQYDGAKASVYNFSAQIFNYMIINDKV